MSYITSTNTELIYANLNAGTAKTTFTTEATPILNDTTGMGNQASLPPNFWASNTGQGHGIHVLARGVLSTTTGPPTYTFSVRLGATGVAGPIVLGSAAITTIASITNQFWELEGDIVLTALGTGAASTVRGQGHIVSPGGFASPFTYGMGASASLTAPTVATVDTTITNFINMSVACSASSASNSVTLQQLLVFGLN